MEREEAALIEAARQMALDITDSEVREQQRKLQAQAYREEMMGRVVKLLSENKRQDAVELLGAWKQGTHGSYYDRYVDRVPATSRSLRSDFFDDQAQTLLSRLQNELEEEDKEKLQKIQALYNAGDYRAVLEQELPSNSSAAYQKAQGIKEQAEKRLKEEKTNQDVRLAILICVVGSIILCITVYLAYLPGKVGY